MADKSVLIAGAGAGLGASLAHCFAGAGYNIAVTARRPERLDDLVAELDGMGVKAEAFGVDASDETAMAGAFDVAEANLGAIDLAVYNVNGRTVKELTELSIDDFESSCRALCLGGFIMGREAAKHMAPEARAPSSIPADAAPGAAWPNSPLSPALRRRSVR